jgi:hypothetical protein
VAEEIRNGREHLFTTLVDEEMDRLFAQTEPSAGCSNSARVNTGGDFRIRVSRRWFFRREPEVLAGLALGTPGRSADRHLRSSRNPRKDGQLAACLVPMGVFRCADLRSTMRAAFPGLTRTQEDRARDGIEDL